MKVTKKTQYFIGEQQVLRIGRPLAAELGVSEAVLRTWTVDNSEFPAPIHSEPSHGGTVANYYPYEPAIKIIEAKLAAFAINKARGVGRPKKTK